MRILVFGADGFIGSNLIKVLEGEVYTATRSGTQSDHQFRVDLCDKKSVASVIRQIKPEVVVNCAGIVSNGDESMMNVEFTDNIISSVHESGLKGVKIIICGSAGSYGSVEAESLPVSEETSLRAEQGYAYSKLLEERRALELGQQYDIPVVVARIFNPIGSGMHKRLLLPQIINQITEIKTGEPTPIEVNRLDSSRDYVDVRDVVAALKVLIKENVKHVVYNIGSGRATTNRELISVVAKCFELEHNQDVIELSETPEQSVASQADISRMYDDFQWRPKYQLSDTIKEIVNATRQ